MENNKINQMKQELENQSKEKLKSLSAEEKIKYAKKERAQNIGIGIFALLFLGALGIFLLSYDTGYSSSNTVGLVGGILLITVGVAFILFVIFDCRKTTDELALRPIKRELKPIIIAQIQKEEQQKALPDSDFVITKEISILASGWSSTKLLIDNQNKKFIYQKGKSFSRTYKFSDLINYEVYENGHSKVKGRAGSALIGGAFFGLGGLIVGSSMSRNINEKCNQLKLIIRLNDFDCPQIMITYVDNVDWDKNGWTYRNMKENLQSVCSMLEFMLNEKTLEQSSTVKQVEKTSEQKSQKEQLQELKEMLDDGLITQEDFEQKKKQILGL